MKRTPSIFTLEYLRSNKDLDDFQAEVDGKWVPARPLGYPSLIHRIKAAWLVFSGKADAVTWPGDQ